MQEEIVKEKYEDLKIEVIEFDSEDVITTSGEGSNDPTFPELPMGG